MGIFNAFKGFVTKITPQPKTIAGLSAGALGGGIVIDAVDNMTTPASPAVVINSQLPTSPSDAPVGSIEWALWTALMSGGNGFNGTAGMAGNNGSDNPKITQSTAPRAGLNILPIILIGVAVIAVIALVIMQPWRRKRGR